MKQYLSILLLAVVACSNYSDGTFCDVGGDCTSGCCGYYAYDLTEAGSSYFEELSASLASLMSDMSDSSVEASSVEVSEVEPQYVCVSDSSADALDASWYDYRKVCSYASQMTVSAILLAMLAYN